MSPRIGHRATPAATPGGRGRKARTGGRHTVFEEVMSGTVRVDGEDRPMRLELHVDLPELLRLWGDTEGVLTGRVYVPGWADDPHATGTLRVAPIAARRIRYRMEFRAGDGRTLLLDGWKSVSYRRPLHSMTHLPATVTDAGGTVVAEARLRFDARRDLLRFLAGFRLPRGGPRRPAGSVTAGAGPAGAESAGGDGTDPGQARGAGTGPEADGRPGRPARSGAAPRALARVRAALPVRSPAPGTSGDSAREAAELFRSRWRGRPGRLEVWYTTLTDPATGTGLWLHHELVAPADGGPARGLGWAVLFPPGEPPVFARFGPDTWPSPDGSTGRSATGGGPGTDSGLSASGSASPSGSVSVPGSPSPSGSTSVPGSPSSSGSVSVPGSPSPSGSLPASGSPSVPGSPSASGSVSAPGSVSVHGSVSASGGAAGAGGFFCAGVESSATRLRGSAGPLEWDLTASGGGAPLYTFPRWAWHREVLPAAQIVPAPAASYDGTVRCGERVLELRAAPGASARIYGHGNAERWAWLHADLGDGDVCEVVAATSTRPGLNRLRPLPFVRLRLDGTDWPGGDPLLTALRARARIGLPSWSVRVRSGDRAVQIEVALPDGGTVAVDYADPDGRAAVCHNSERADARITLLRRDGSRWRTERHWHLEGLAHAEVGLR